MVEVATALDYAFSILAEVVRPFAPAGVNPLHFLGVFLVSYAISLMVVKKIHFLKDNVLSQVFISLVIAYFTSTSNFSLYFITKLFPNLGISLAILFSILAVMSFVLPKKNLQDLKWAPLIVLIGLMSLVILMGGNLGINLSIPELSPDMWGAIMFIGLFIIILVVGALSVREKKSGGNGFKKFLKTVLKALRGDEDVWK